MVFWKIWYSKGNLKLSVGISDFKISCQLGTFYSFIYILASRSNFRKLLILLKQALKYLNSFSDTDPILQRL